MTELTTYSGGGLSRDARRTSRQLGRGRLGTQLRTTEVDNVTDVALAKVDNLTMATGSAMQQVTRVATAQRQLEQLTPEAAGRLAFLADDHMLSCAELLGDLRRDLRRVR
jgi:predicted RecB family endonuclease